MVVPTDLESYTPTTEQLDQAEALCDLLKQSYGMNLEVSLIGGYGLDALFGRLTRDHKDIDLLISRVSRENFVELITSLGYVSIPEEFDQRRRKEAYSHSITGLKIEFAVLDMEMLIPLAERFDFPAELTIFLPETFNGHLLSLTIRVPSIEGMEIIDLIQAGTAAEKAWKPYPHIAHRARLLAVLKNRKIM